ncbi:uncharacterized protein LOC122366396 [Amphibalanus amphitrite]|uniref:uncharacterized protein LOC122366396 n=2 Tax=Amphibalanus amphitrite TaxID=1232801 RepID=UPI001C8FCF9B|nr:uncharacterized protein LOC122366396 [Amphibalanus amphitrite]
MDGIRPPGPFMDTAAAGSVPWSAWYADFELYATTIGWSQWDEARQRALLLHCLGQEGRRRYRVAEAAAVPAAVPAAEPAAEPQDAPLSGDTGTGTDSGTDSRVQVKSEDGGMAQCLSLLQHLFDKPRDIMSERVKFRRLRQKTGESTASFITTLREQSRYCAFGALEDEMIRDQFVEGCTSDHLRNRLCAEDHLTLQRLESIAMADDRAVERRRLFGGDDGGQPSRAAAATEPLEVAYTARDKTPAQRPPVDKTKGKFCYACGRRGHVSTDDWCPAKGQKCRRCGTVGHFAVRCPQKPAKEVRAVEPDVVEVLAVNQNDSALQFNVRLDGNWVTMLVDTGAAVSIIPRQLYETALSHRPLLPTTVNLRAYGGSQLVVTGVITASVETEDGRSCQGRLYVVDGGTPLLGRDLQKSLCISTWHGSTVYEVDRQPGRSSDVEAGNDQDSATQRCSCSRTGVRCRRPLEGARLSCFTDDQ